MQSSPLLLSMTVQVMLHVFIHNKLLLSIQRSLGLHLILFPSNLACSVLCVIQLIAILSTYPNIGVLAYDSD